MLLSEVLVASRLYPGATYDVPYVLRVLFPENVFHRQYLQIPGLNLCRILLKYDTVESTATGKQLQRENRYVEVVLDTWNT